MIKPPIPRISPIPSINSVVFWMRWARWLCMGMLFWMLSACSFAPRQIPASLTAEQANDVTLRAIGLVGTPYRYGGNSPETGFDCSGFIGYVYKTSAELKLPRTVELLQDVGNEVPYDRARTGDLVVFSSRGTANHAGIYVGDSRFVHAPSTGGAVRVESLAKRYWAELNPAFRRP